MPVTRKVNVKKLSKDSSVQTEEDGDYPTDWPLLKSSQHVQYGSSSKSNDGFEKEYITHGVESKPCIKKWALEPFLFLYMFSYMMILSSLTNMVLQKACLNHLKYSVEICNNLTFYNDEKEKVERLGSVYSQYNTLIHMGVGAVVMIIVGPWSDRFGRKPPLIISMIGILFHDVGLILNTVYFDWTLDYLLISFVPLGATGGIICVMSTIYSIASELSAEKTRTIKYALVELGFGMGMAFGSLIGGYLYDAYSYLPEFIVPMVIHVICLLWAIFFIQETSGSRILNEHVPLKQKLLYLFSLQNLSGGFKAAIKKRPNYGRVQIWLLMIAMSSMIITYASISSIAYIYAFHMYNWGPSEYAKVNTLFSILSIVVSVICVPVAVKVFKIGDPILGFIGSLSMGIKNVCIAFANHEWLYYTGSAFGLFSGIGMLSVRSQVSKLVEKDELGKVFTFVSAAESLVPVLGTIAMTYIFNASLDFLPGLCYLLAGVLLIAPAISFIWMAQLESPAVISVNVADDALDSDTCKP